MNPLPAPYNFVPVTEHIYHPPWAALVSHDVPFADGICGSFEITVTAVTPVFVRWKKEDPHFYQAYPGGPFAIPGSSLKGMIRAVVEIIALGKLGRFVNDKQSYRGNIIITENIKAKLAVALPAHIADWPPDLAETIFGFTNGDDGLRSRVSFDTQVTAQKNEDPSRSLTLLQPNVRCAPIYLDQAIADPATGQVSPGSLRKFDSGDSRLRGWKRYPARSSFGSDNSQTPVSLKSSLQPLPAGTVFIGRVRVHNLRPAELGALIWALVWNRSDPLVAPGGNDCCHTLGLAKPYGYGAVQINISLPTSADLSSVDGAAVNLARCRNEFVSTMETFLPGWAGSKPLRHLLAMADPGRKPPSDLRYAKATELQAAKADGYALLPYVAAPAVSPSSVLTPFPPGATGFVRPEQGRKVCCTILDEKTPKGGCYLQGAGDPDGFTHGVFTAPPPVSLSPGRLVECEAKSVAPRSHAYKFLRLLP